MAGNPLHRMFAFVHPHVAHAITTSMEAPVVEAADHATGHLLRQTMRISRGEKLEHLTTLSAPLPPPS